MNNTSCNQPKVVLEPEIQAPRDKEWQHGVVTTFDEYNASDLCMCHLPACSWGYIKIMLAMHFIVLGVCFLRLWCSSKGQVNQVKWAPIVEGFEKQHFKLLICEDYANLSLTTFSPVQMAGTKNQLFKMPQ